MRRADRLFQIIQILRPSHRPVSASQLAEELEVSQRSVYRDIADLIGQRVPIIIGYAETVRLLAGWCELRRGFRHFRTDRIVSAEFLQEPYGCRPRELQARWRRFMEAERGIRLP